MSDQSDRRWAVLARELEFTQLTELRRQAEGWRTGLTGLTALLAILAVLKGRDDLTQLPEAARYWATTLIAAAFLLLVAGSVLAVRAAHGRPGDRIQQAGQALREWTEQEVVRVTQSLRYASLCCLSGVLLVAVAVGISWTTTASPDDHLVQVGTTTGGLCGKFVRAGGGGVVVRVDDGDGARNVTLPVQTVDSVTPVNTCGASG
ncbi:hypothetical protein [Streptomyces sp. NPDC048436]|uniref:hypothetical protein n=1 Tax=Streptomyces sp. NPDC048436 TaxID=3365550 RepID=UPI00371E7297